MIGFGDGESDSDDGVAVVGNSTDGAATVGNSVDGGTVVAD